MAVTPEMAVTQGMAVAQEMSVTQEIAVTQRTCGQTPLPVLCSAHIVCNIISM